MEVDDFLKLQPQQIRSDEKLMQLYVKLYEAAFFYKPSCAGCSLKKGFVKLQNFYRKGKEKNIKFEVMKTKKTFQIKKKYLTKILTFKRDGVTHRKYGNRVDESFAIELVNSGQTELFDKLPVINKVEPKIEENQAKGVDYYSMPYREEVLPLYNELSNKIGRKAKSRKKDDIIAFLIENEN